MKRFTETQEHYDERVVDYVERRRIDINGVYKDIREKREFLRDFMGYNGLMVGRNQFTPLAKCSDERVSGVVRGIYNGAKKRVQKTKESHK